MIDETGNYGVIVPHKHGQTTITLLAYPGPEDWWEVKRRALITVGKRPKTVPTSEWIEKMLDARHSPIRYAMYSFQFEGIPSNTATHFARHVHAQPYVSTLRTDRVTEIDGDMAPRCTKVDMILDVNAEELMIMSNKRLCMQAAEVTRRIMEGMTILACEVTPEMNKMLVPMCKYCGGKCHEYKGCGMCPPFLDDTEVR